MRFIPILFSTPMVQAILNGQKTMTRRTRGLERYNENPDSWNLLHKSSYEDLLLACPYGQPGDVLWVRETFYADRIGVIDGEEKFKCYYRATSPGFSCKHWKPSIHMPKVAARIFLQVVSVRVERLNSITEQDAMAEGVETLGLYPGYSVSSRGKFEGLWNHINGSDSWDANLWVWVITFKKIDKPTNFI